MSENFEGQNKSKTKTNAQRYLNFSLSAEEYAIPLHSVKEVIAMPEITPVPYTPPHFLGIMNLRGQVISVIDLRLKLGMKSEKTQETSVIICDFGDRSIGMVVSSINSVMALDESDVAPKPEIHSHKNTEYILGVAKKDKKLVLLLDLSKSLTTEESAAVQKATQQPTPLRKAA